MKVEKSLGITAIHRVLDCLKLAGTVDTYIRGGHVVMGAVYLVVTQKLTFSVNAGQPCPQTS